MKAVLYYLSLLFLILFIAASGDSCKKPERTEIPVQESSILHTACTIPEISVSLKETFTSLILSQSVPVYFSEIISYSEKNVSESKLKLYSGNAYPFKRLKKEPYTSVNYIPSEEIEDHNLC